MRYSQNKDIAKLVQRYVRKGWCYHRRRKHGVLMAPNGRTVTVPSTPSDVRALKNLKTDLRRNHD